MSFVRRSVASGAADDQFPAISKYWALATRKHRALSGYLRKICSNATRRQVARPAVPIIDRAQQRDGVQIEPCSITVDMALSPVPVAASVPNGIVLSLAARPVKTSVAASPDVLPGAGR